MPDQMQQATAEPLDTLSAGGAGKNGALVLRSADDKNRIRLYSGIQGSRPALCHLGGRGAWGELALFGPDAPTPIDGTNAIVSLRMATIRAGGQGVGGELLLYGPNAASNAWAMNSTIDLRASDATVLVGGNGQDGDVVVRNANNMLAVHVNGQTGDILLANADCAEEFDVIESEAEPGTVLVLGDDGRLRACDSAYDTRVAGIASGAGEYRPALVLDRKPGREGRRPVALAGKVCCKVEAHAAPITVGTLLTTSSVPGHARAATDRDRAFGAVIGKALAPLESGLGVVPVLVSLQ